MAKQTKKAQALATKLGDNMQLYPVTDAITLLRDLGTAKFDQTIEVAMNLGVDPRHADQMVRGMVSLPSGTGKTVRVALSPVANTATRTVLPVPEGSETMPRTIWSA